MDDLINFLKPRKIILPTSFQSRTAEEIILFILNIIEEDKISLSKVLNVIYAVNLELTNLIRQKIENIYGITIDFDELLEEAKKNVSENWEEITQKFLFQNIIDGGFKKEKE